ncbi:hypothetical protein AVL50_29865 [Flammeovirga sp. SJP92]|nr:hypothetical protein AVL50_29865 [Flammeovirga sp. SJP92]
MIGIFLPSTPKASKSLLFAKIQKDQRLKETSSPRIIFVGGSNLSFSLNSQLIQEALQMPVINMGINEGIGIRYNLASIKRYIRKGDIIIVIPEYTQFYIQNRNCSVELARTILDLNKTNIELLEWQQIPSFLMEVPPYAFSKFNPFEYFFYSESDIYSVHSFNQYGDVNAHWNLAPRPFPPLAEIDTSKFNQDILQYILHFENEIKKKNAQLYISYPALQQLSFKNSIKSIRKVQKELEKTPLTIIGSPDRYIFKQELMFNSPYHLSKKGVDLRTMLLIEDLKTL